MKDKLYIILYYLAFVITLGLVVIYSSTLVDFYGEGINFLPYALLIFINIIIVVVFTIMLIKNKKMDKTLIAFPISYILFVVILYLIGMIFDKKMVIPMIEYNYFNLFIMIDYLLLNMYSLLSFDMKWLKKIYKNKKKAFTLIELLAVIIILGIIMVIAIPSVTKYISNSRKESYATTAKSIVDGAKTIVNEGNLPLFDPTATYYLPYDMIETETGGSRTPYGEMKEAYVVVTYEKMGYDYYWTSVDEAGQGIVLIENSKLDKNKIQSNTEDISTDVSICGKNNIIVFNSDGTVKETKVATSCYNTTSGEIGEIKNPVCKRATTLHTATCENGNRVWSGGKYVWRYYCKQAGYTETGSKQTSMITYGNLGTAGTLTAGDAFDCDVNNDSFYNTENERFYYLGSSGGNAQFIYYNNVSGGVPNNSTTYNYSADYGTGPDTAYAQLPTTTQWSHPSLVKNYSRQIKTKGGYTYFSRDHGGSYTLPVFNYENRAARLIIPWEITHACGTGMPYSQSGISAAGYLEKCVYLLENTDFSSSSIGNDGYWTESWAEEYDNTRNPYDGVFITSGMYRGFSTVAPTNPRGVRPVIEVPEAEVEY